MDNAPAVLVCQTLLPNDRICGQPVISPGVPYCQEHVALVDDAGKSRYLSSMPEAMRKTYREHFGSGSSKDLSPEIAVSRTVLSSIMKQIDSRGRTDSLFAKLGSAIKESQPDANASRTITIMLNSDESATVFDVLAEDKARLSQDDIDNMNKALTTIQRVVESQAKVNPDWVLSRDEMRTIMRELIGVIERAIPVEHMPLRIAVVQGIEDHVVKKIESRAMQIGLGTRPKGTVT